MFVEMCEQNRPAVQSLCELEVEKVALHHRFPGGWVRGAVVWRLWLGGGAFWAAGRAGYGSCL